MDNQYLKQVKTDLLENGMVAEVLPQYINTNEISKVKFKELNKSNRSSSPITINLLKNDGGNRVISLPNPVSYQQLIVTIFKKPDIFEKVIEKIQKNEFSHSKILNDDKTFNIPIKGIKSNFANSRREKMFLSIGTKYSLKYDIEKFYDSIYTHYLPAGLIGFSNALEMFRNSKKHSEEYEYMTNIDKDMRNLSNGETKGIVTGPFVSRIFSELLQSEIDTEIFHAIQNKKFRRYVDDTEIYFNTRDEAEKNIEIIKTIFQKYKLSLKMEKTVIKKFPYIDFSTVRDLLNIRRIKNKEKVGWYFASQDDLFEVLDKAEKMQQDGNKGILKYVLKILNSQKNEYGINDKFMEKDKSFLYLLNYMVIYPQYSKEILKILDNNIKYIQESEKMLNDTLSNFIKDNQDLVCLYLIQIMLKNKLQIKEKIILNYLEKEMQNELLKAVFIEYLCENNVNKKYNLILLEQVKRLKSINGIDFRLEDWLSKYILYFYDYISDNECNTNNNFYNNFRLYKDNNIKFINFDIIR